MGSGLLFPYTSIDKRNELTRRPLMIPHPPGVLIAVVSAALFSLALVYVIRSRRGRSDLESTLPSALAGGLAEADRLPFSGLLVERRPPAVGLIVSIVLHAWVIIGGPLLPYLFPEKLHIDFRNYNVKIMEFRLPTPLMYTPGPSAGPERRPAKRAPKILAAERKGVIERRSALERPLRAQFELPVSVRSKTRDVVIQPDQPPEIALVMHQKLPTTFLWAQQPAPPEPTRLAGLPRGLRLVPRPFSLPQTLPQVQLPNRELAIADLQIGPAPVLTFRSPRLPVAAANVTPVRSPAEVEAPGELPATELPTGVPINLIALMRRPAPASLGYLLEAGNRLAESASAAGQPDSSKTGEGAAKGAAAGAAGPEAGGSAGSPGGAAAGANSAASPGAAATDAPSGTSASGSAEAAALAKGTHADLLAAAAKSASVDLEKRKDSADTQPAPRGSLGVVIVQQSGQETALEGGDALSGQPVYTVFFDVPGAPRRWILQYCIPGSTATPSMAQDGDVIRIVPRKSVQPPFPLQRIPFDVAGYEGNARRLVVFAIVNERGETESVRLIRGTGHEIDQTAVATLARWSFRPAMRGDTPVPVEALFGIPLQ